MAMEEALAPIGWKRASRHRDVYRPSVGGVVVKQLALNGTVDARTGAASFLPALGVRHAESVELEGAFLGLPKSSSRFAATIGCGLMDLLPVDKRNVTTRWHVSVSAEVARVMAVVCEDFFLYGLPYYQQFNTVASIINHLKSCKRSQDQDGKLAILAALSGCREDAIDALSRFAAVAKGQSPPISVQSWRFVRKFVEHFGFGESLLSG